MPTWLALSFALVASIIQNVFGAPLLILQRAYGAPGSPLATVLALLRTPFPKAAALVGLLGSLVRTGLLLEGFAAGKAGELVNSALRSSSSSSSSANGSAPIDASHLLYIESTSYPLTLSALLSSALALPVPAPDAPPFPAHEVREWSEKSEILRAKLEAGMERAAKEWLAVLEYLPPLSAGEPETVEGERERRTTYLCAALDELEAVTSRRPTRFVYLESSAFDDADLEREEERIREAERQERAKKDREFDEWVESIMGAAAASPADDAEEAKKKRTQMLDQPMGNGGETFRQALRTQWNAMYDSSSGGVLGNVAREFENIAAKYGGGSDEDQDTVGLPQPVQIMAAHHLRSQLVATLDALKPRDSRFAYNKKGEDDFLPPSMRGIMNLFQRSYTLRQATCQP